LSDVNKRGKRERRKKPREKGNGLEKKKRCDGKKGNKGN